MDYRVFIAALYDETEVESFHFSIHVVQDYSDVFPVELPGLPPKWEVDFSIEIYPRVGPISIAPYRMALTKLKELKNQIQDLLDRKFICPSTSPWGAPVLFVKNKMDHYVCASTIESWISWL